jgi:hypothetical protein
MKYGKHYLSIKRPTWVGGVLSGHFKSAWQGLDLQEIENPSYEDFEPLIDQIETGVKWRDLVGYSKEAMEPVFADPQTRLFLLKRGADTVGYSLVIKAKPAFTTRFNASAKDEKIIEIENLALFEAYRGDGLGKSYFEMMFKELFKTHNVVCWGTSDFNAPTLLKFYTDRLRMNVLGYDAPKAKVT